MLAIAAAGGAEDEGVELTDVADNVLGGVALAPASAAAAAAACDAADAAEGGMGCGSAASNALPPPLAPAEVSRELAAAVRSFHGALSGPLGSRVVPALAAQLPVCAGLEPALRQVAAVLGDVVTAGATRGALYDRRVAVSAALVAYITALFAAFGIFDRDPAVAAAAASRGAAPAAPVGIVLRRVCAAAFPGFEAVAPPFVPSDVVRDLLLLPVGFVWALYFLLSLDHLATDCPRPGGGGDDDAEPGGGTAREARGEADEDGAGWVLDNIFPHIPPAAMAANNDSRALRAAWRLRYVTQGFLTAPILLRYRPEGWAEGAVPAFGGCWHVRVAPTFTPHSLWVFSNAALLVRDRGVVGDDGPLLVLLGTPPIRAVAMLNTQVYSHCPAVCVQVPRTTAGVSGRAKAVPTLLLCGFGSGREALRACLALRGALDTDNASSCYACCAALLPTSRARCPDCLRFFCASTCLSPRCGFCSSLGRHRGPPVLPPLAPLMRAAAIPWRSLELPTVRGGLHPSVPIPTNPLVALAAQMAGCPLGLYAPTRAILLLVECDISPAADEDDDDEGGGGGGGGAASLPINDGDAGVVVVCSDLVLVCQLVGGDRDGTNAHLAFRFGGPLATLRVTKRKPRPRLTLKFAGAGGGAVIVVPPSNEVRDVMIDAMREAADDARGGDARLPLFGGGQPCSRCRAPIAMPVKAHECAVCHAALCGKCADKIAIVAPGQAGWVCQTCLRVPPKPPSATQCTVCGQEFSMFFRRRRRVCRACGVVVCSSCQTSDACGPCAEAVQMCRAAGKDLALRGGGLDVDPVTGKLRKGARRAAKKAIKQFEKAALSAAAALRSGASDGDDDGASRSSGGPSVKSKSRR